MTMHIIVCNWLNIIRALKNASKLSLQGKLYLFIHLKAHANAIQTLREYTWMLFTVRQLEVRKHGESFSNQKHAWPSNFQIKNKHDHQKLPKAFDGHADKPDSDSKHYFCKRKCGFYASICGKYCGKNYLDDTIVNCDDNQCTSSNCVSWCFL